jgi:processing peptidase subunit alpha
LFQKLLHTCLLTYLLPPPSSLPARATMSFQRAEAAAQPQVLATELLQSAAYGSDSAFGRSEKCPEDRVQSLTAATLRAFAGRSFVAPRMVLSCVGVEHSVAVAAAKKWLGDVPTAPPNGTALGERPIPKFIGGDERRAPDWAAMPATVSAATAKTDFTHVMIAFPTVGWAEDDVVPICVVDTLLGGGSSFSAGGPGKGMYSRLYREVLNSFAYVESANAFSTQLFDSGLVGIYGAAPPEHAGDLASLMCGHLARLAEVSVNNVELSRARNQLASSVLMNLESRTLLAEDIGRQMLSKRKRLDPAVLTQRIQAVTPADVKRVMRTALAGRPALSVVGDATRVPEYVAFENFFAQQFTSRKE